MAVILEFELAATVRPGGSDFAVHFTKIIILVSTKNCSKVGAFLKM